ncbi:MULTISPECIES: biotin transporter BioY [unclassified Variovorax]|uniref:biotin transporter BioY n=1 Tax=unclassified Variovorax TaxID=663243 RepID=UPI002576A862|nr:MULTISPECIES: biotin transporter BioY [unclassified Variovorax]MDM0091278.1 biotin transporter BioY [Variovorax sp. J22G40]MDM0149495.1 biotin transporter BioY [Variovorax sp. J2P1-31]
MTSSAGSLTSSRSLSYVALFAALMAVFGLIPKIDLPFGVPITLQSLGVMLAGCLLGPRRGFCAVALFLLAVALGLPLLPGGRGGLGVFVGPTAGFLFGWMFGAFACGLLMRRMARLSGAALWAGAFAAALVGGILVVYAFGIAGLSWVAHMSLTQATMAMLVFIPGDLVKCALCALLVQTVMRGMPGWRLDRD